MVLTLLSVLSAHARPSDEEGAALFTAWADHARLQPPGERAPAPPRGGADLLTGWKRGDLLILQDEDGEWFAEAVMQLGSGNFDYITNSMINGFYNYNPDEYDYVCVLLLRDFGMFFAFYQPIANDTLGIGYDDIVSNEVFDQDPSNALDGLIFMNYEGLWSQNYASGRYVFGQEFGHRWGAFTDAELVVGEEVLDSKSLLGRDVAHWSYWFSTSNSPMEGVAWLDNGDGTWTTDHTATSTYSDLDMYLMGFWGPEQVGAQTFLQVSAEEQQRVGREPASSPDYFNCTLSAADCVDVTVTATAVPFGVDAIIAAEGERVPAASESPREFRMGFIVLALNGDDVSDAALDRVDQLRQTWEADWEEDVRQEADLITTQEDNSAPEWGSVTDDTGGDDSGVAGDSGEVDSDGAAEVDGPKEEPGGCGCSAGGAGAGLGLLAAGLGLLAARRRG